MSCRTQQDIIHITFTRKWMIARIAEDTMITYMTRLSSHRYLTSHSAAAAQRSAYSTAPTAQRSQRGEHSSAYSPAITAQRGEHSAFSTTTSAARR